MSYDLSEDWFIEETGERLILDQEKVAAELARLRERCEAYKGQVEAGAREIARLRARANESTKLLDKAAKDIERLAEAKRRALAIADERSKENVGVKAENERLRAIIRDARDHVPYDVLARIDAVLAKKPAS